MSRTVTKITCNETFEDSIKIEEFDKYESYNVTVTTTDGDKQIVFVGDYTYQEINAGKYNDPDKENYLPETKRAAFKNAVKAALVEHNQKIRDSVRNLSSGDGTVVDVNGTSLEYIIYEQNDDSSYKYDKMINGVLDSSGNGFYKDLKTKPEKVAWKAAVKKYKEENGIHGVTWNLEKAHDDVMNAIHSLDLHLPQVEMPDPPLIVTAIPKLITDPCDFVQSLKHSSNVAITIDPPAFVNSMKELLSYFIKYATHTITQIGNNAVQMVEPVVETAENPLESYYTDMKDYLSDVDAINEEVKKQDAEYISTYRTYEYELPPLPETPPEAAGSGASGEWWDCVVKMGKWYQDNIHTYWGATDSKGNPARKSYPCPLINNKDVQDDCSSFVKACLMYFGFDKSSLGHMATASMQPGSKFDTFLTSNGFERLTYSVSTRMPGDILCGPPASHTEIYAGDGKSYSWGSVHDGLGRHQGMPCRTCEQMSQRKDSGTSNIQRIATVTYTHMWRYTGS